MPSRNEPCPCGSGQKYKRCCLVKLDVVTRELRERDAFLDDLIAWVRAEHAQTLEDAGSHTTLIRMLRGVHGRNMSLIWALNDYRPRDGGPTLIERYIARPELGPSVKAIAHGLAAARLAVYRVGPLAPGVWLELESLNDDAPVRVAWQGGFEHLQVAETLVVRVVHATTAPTLWGLGARFSADGETRWKARLAALPSDSTEAALTVLGFHPDDAAEPLPDGVELHTMTWSIKDDERVLEVIEDDELWECLGEAIPSGWAFAWPDEATSGVADLGGWREEAGEIEAARLIVREQDITLLSADRGTLREIAFLLEANLGELIAPRRESLAA
jgi:SEC-C motif